MLRHIQTARYKYNASLAFHQILTFARHYYRMSMFKFIKVMIMIYNNTPYLSINSCHYSFALGVITFLLEQLYQSI